MDMLFAFAFFEFPVKLDPLEICKNASQLVKLSQFGKDSAVECVDQTDDQLMFMIGHDFGCVLHRMPIPFPPENLDQDDPYRHRVLESREHWSIISPGKDDPLNRLITLVRLSLMMQSISMSSLVRAFMPSPLGLIYRASDWEAVIRTMLKDKTLPVWSWIGFDTKIDGAGITAVSCYMDELVGTPNIELLHSNRSEDETVDLLECAVLETIMRGPLHKGPKHWLTKTGVRFRVQYARSDYDPKRKATQLIED